MTSHTISRCFRCTENTVVKTLFHSPGCGFLPWRRRANFEAGFRKLLHSTNKRGLNAICRLDSRGIVRLSGKDTVDYLQGLVTNDANHLLTKSPAVQYCMMLNVQGRVLYDLFLYNTAGSSQNSPTVLVDADVSVIDDLVKIFRKYKLRKKVDISDVSDHYKIWSKFEVSEGTSNKEPVSVSSDALKFHDPRVPLFASRIVTEGDGYDAGSDQVSEADYRIHRYKWGIPEGVADLPPGNCLPLESNLAFMNGVNFQKGCYIGQELTARTFHTGVIRKRLVPLFFSSSVDVEADSTITTEEKGKNAGKFRSSEGSYGIGLLRLQHVQDRLVVQTRAGEKIPVKTQLPAWWPNLTV